METPTINTHLTEKEAAFLVLCLNYRDLESQLSDNYSNGGIDEAMGLFEGTRQHCRQAAGGLLSSLQQKGMGNYDPEYDQFALSERGVRAAFAARKGRLFAARTSATQRLRDQSPAGRKASGRCGAETRRKIRPRGLTGLGFSDWVGA